MIILQIACGIILAVLFFMFLREVLIAAGVILFIGVVIVLGMFVYNFIDERFIAPSRVIKSIPTYIPTPPPPHISAPITGTDIASIVAIVFVISYIIYIVIEMKKKKKNNNLYY